MSRARVDSELVDLARSIAGTDGDGHIYPSHAIRALEDEIDRRGMQVRYIEALAELTPHYRAYPEGYSGAMYPPLSVFVLMRATPEQRARAFLQAVKG